MSRWRLVLLLGVIFLGVGAFWVWYVHAALLDQLCAVPVLHETRGCWQYEFFKGMHDR